MKDPWIKKERLDEKAIWLEHISAAWRIAAFKVNGKFKYTLFQKARGNQHWTVFGIYDTADDAKAGQEYNAPNRLIAEPIRRKA